MTLPQFFGSLFATCTLMLLGCDRPVSAPDPSIGDTGGAVSYRLSDSVLASLSNQADSIRLTLHRKDQPDRSLSCALGCALQLDHLAAGDWNAEVALYRRDGSLTWYGAAGVAVAGGRIAVAAVELRPSTGKVTGQIVLDTGAAPTIRRRDTVELGSDPKVINTFRKVLWAVVWETGVEIGVVSNPQFSVPKVVRVGTNDTLRLEVGDPFIECGGFTGPCQTDSVDSSRVQVVFVPLARQSGACVRSVQGAGPALLVDAACRAQEIQKTRSFSSFDFVVAGGYDGTGTGEAIHLQDNGLLERVTVDPTHGNRLDTFTTILDDTIMAHLDSVLARSDVRSLPAPVDTIGRVESLDGFYDHIVMKKDHEVVLDLIVGERSCWVKGKVEIPPCPESPGMVSLNTLIEKASEPSAEFVSLNPSDDCPLWSPTGRVPARPGIPEASVAIV